MRSRREVGIRVCTGTAGPHHFFFPCLVKRKTLDQLNFIKFNFCKERFTNWDTPEAKQVQRNPRAATGLGDIYSVGKKKKKPCSLETARSVPAGVSALFE